MADKDKKEYTDQESREQMTEIKTGRRVFDTKRYGLLQIRFPKVEENRLADWEYSKIFQQAIMDDIPTNKEMAKTIERKGLWSKEDDDKVDSLQDEIQKQVTVLSKMADGSKNMDKVQDKINELRQEIFKMQQERQRWYNNTAESKAEEAKMSFLIYKCTEFADGGKNVWSKYEDFKNEEDQEAVNTIVYQFITFINGLPSDYLSQSSTSDEKEVEETETEQFINSVSGGAN